MATDPFGHRQTSEIAPVEHCQKMTLTGDTLLNTVSTGVLVQGNGVVKVDMAGTGTGVTLPLAAGVVHPLRVVKVYSTGNGTTVDEVYVFWNV